MKKKLSFLLSVLLLATLLTTIAIYKRPMTLEQMCPGISLENCQSIKMYHYVEGTGAESGWVPAIYPARSEPFEAIMDQLEGRKFRKSLRNWLPSNGIHCYPQHSRRYSVGPDSHLWRHTYAGRQYRTWRSYHFTLFLWRVAVFRHERHLRSLQYPRTAAVVGIHSVHSDFYFLNSTYAILKTERAINRHAPFFVSEIFVSTFSLYLPYIM